MEGDFMALLRSEAIVLRTRDFGEADKILTLLTADYGKVSAVAKGCRRIRNRLMGVSAPFVHMRALIFEGKSLDTLSQGELIHSFIDIREDLEKMAYAAYMAEVVDQMTEEKHPVPLLFKLLLGCFQVLSDGHNPDVVARYFDVNCLSILGYRPQLNFCVACDNETELSCISAVAGGVLCASCGKQDQTAVPLSPGALQMLRRFLITSVDRLKVLQVSAEMLREMERAMRLFMDYRLPGPLKSLDFLNTVRSVS